MQPPPDRLRADALAELARYVTYYGDACQRYGQELQARTQRPGAQLPGESERRAEDATHQTQALLMGAITSVVNRCHRAEGAYADETAPAAPPDLSAAAYLAYTQRGRT